MSGRKASTASLVALAALAAHCTFASDDDDDGGLTVDVAAAALAVATATTTTDLGYDVTVTRGWVALGTVEIVPCASASRMQRWSWGGLRAAHAHGTTEPKKLAVPAILPIAASGEVDLALGTLKPPPGSYCDARITLASADEDAVGMPEDGSMVGLSLLVDGTFTGPASGEAAPFSFTASTSVSGEMPAAYELSAEGRQRAALTVVVDGAAAFDGVDFAAEDDDAAAQRVLSNVIARLSGEVE